MQILSDKDIKEFQELYSFAELVNIVSAEIAESENWTNVPNTVKQAMNRGRINTVSERKKGHSPMFTQDEVERYLEYLRKRPLRGGAVRTHDLERFKPLLGIKTDETIAMLAQCSQNTVYKYRSDLGIESTMLLEPEERRLCKVLSETELELVGMTLSEGLTLIAEGLAKKEARKAKARIRKAKK